MAFIPVTIKGQQIRVQDELEELTFKELSLKETHLEEFIRLNIGRLFGDEESLLIVGQQVIDDERSRSDLIALDDQGCLVLMEIKRDLQDIKSRSETLESQAIRYASSLAKIKNSRELVEKMFGAYIDRHRDEEPYKSKLGAVSAHELASREVNGFLKQNNINSEFNKIQRIILIASEFDAITLSSSAWLIKNGVDISCYQLSPMKMSAQHLLNFERILPTESVDDFFIGIKSEVVEEDFPAKSKFRKTRTSLPRMNTLFEWGILKGGDRLKIKNFPNSEVTVIDTKTVKYGDSTLSFNEWGQMVTGWSSICIYEWAVLTSSNKTLHDLRLAKLQEVEKAAKVQKAA